MLRHQIATLVVDKPRWLERVPVWLVVAMAQLLSFSRPIGWYPEWNFSAGWGNNDLFTKARRTLWEYFARRRLQIPILARQHGFLMNLYLGNDLTQALYVNGCYEPNEMAFLKSVLGTGMTFVDVGANDGLYTLFASRLVGMRGKVLAFEPSAREFNRLKRNLRWNLSPNVSPFKIALSDHPGIAMLSVADYGHEGQNTLGKFIYDVDLLRKEEVECERFDDLAERLRLKKVHAMKIDVEGGEYCVLKGMCYTLQQHHPLLLLELTNRGLESQGSSVGGVLQLLSSLGYKFLRFDNASGLPVSTDDLAFDHENIIAAYDVA